MTREEAIKSMEYSKAQAEIALSKGVSQYWKQEINWTIEALDMAIEALEGVCFDEWCTDCKEYDTEKKCCPRFNKVIREALKREPSEDGTQGISFENDTKIKSYSKDSDLISKAEAIEALGEEPPVWCDEEYEIAERDQWRADVEAIKSVPSADRPKGKWIDENNSNYANCSECGYQIDTHEERGYHNFCPNCGANMKGNTK